MKKQRLIASILLGGAVGGIVLNGYRPAQSDSSLIHSAPTTSFEYNSNTQEWNSGKPYTLETTDMCIADINRDGSLDTLAVLEDGSVFVDLNSNNGYFPIGNPILPMQKASLDIEVSGNFVYMLNRNNGTTHKLSIDLSTPQSPLLYASAAPEILLDNKRTFRLKIDANGNPVEEFIEDSLEMPKPEEKYLGPRPAPIQPYQRELDKPKIIV